MRERAIKSLLLFLLLLSSTPRERRKWKSITVSILFLNVQLSCTVQGLWSWKGSSGSWMALSKSRKYSTSMERSQSVKLKDASYPVCLRYETWASTMPRCINVGEKQQSKKGSVAQTDKPRCWDGFYVHRQDTTK